ncbi:MAG: oxidoreductase-like domain-containing protein [Burkholderiales bacterium]
MVGESLTGMPPDDPKPVAPDPDNYSGCCDSGCTPCIYDRYWEAMAQYEKALAEWQSRQAADTG